ncbi:hypothetical protein N7532_005479 [Penicillium argentinense]|uniref:Autophagy-related protein 16 domain-containing protein n=1 Tax=Penicillium argentinense TaxID=1131581 RepID=A0A9W9FDZ5_9EURO|nr:uncharacterized protein N7532_005479 [Penicillium argentinense]KAJ5098478.1 hypothetical protein N7532_005479 [Penicillium argentinense]
MAHWREEYLAALAVRDEREKANIALYDAYARLADRTAKQHPTIEPTSNVLGDQRLAGSSGAQPDAATRKQSTEPGPSRTELLNIARSDLAEAQRSRSELQGRLERITSEAEKLRKKSVQDGRRINTLENERVHLQLRLKDRDEELKGKAKLLEDFQDEMASLNLQLNMAEQRSTKLQRENQELVDRWMARMGREADAMNNASKFS